MDSDKLIHQEVVVKDSTVESQDDSPKLGEWYWIQIDDSRRLGCVTHIGSNYVRLDTVNSNSFRVHFDEFFDKCEFEANPNKIIEDKIEYYKQHTNFLMQKVKEITAELAITNNQALPEHETQTMMVKASSEPVSQYKASLIQAQKKTLPDLFYQIQQSNEMTSMWMSAQLIPLKSQAQELHGSIDLIKERIFNVELYAGLIESIEQILDGEPASLNTKIHLMQRRLYMDEECLVRYKTGGMEFNNLGEFDKWIADSDNFKRILPFPRTIAAFQVRRFEKERQAFDLMDFIRIIDERATDKFTFLYIRNGDKLFRLSTEIKFGSKLFPDIEAQKYRSGVLWASMDASRIELIDDDEYQSIKSKDSSDPDSYFSRTNRYVKYSPDSVYFDDITASIRKEMQDHNRLVLVLQGLLDRSPVMHPHPPWSLISPGGFQQALELVYDDSRTLVAGSSPDFQAYWAELNKSLRAGSITVGQEIIWEKREAEKEYNRQCQRGSRQVYHPSRFRPYGDPGPGTLARVVHIERDKCVYRWERKRLSYNSNFIDNNPIPVKLIVKSSNVLNVSAYKPGDFKQFFNDPRTRSNYLQWAPLLLEAEEYYAGNRKVADIPKIKPKKKPDPYASQRYQLKKLCKSMVGKAVHLTCKITTKGGRVYEPESLWRVTSSIGSKLSLCGITKDGKKEIGDDGFYSRSLTHIEIDDIKVDPSIPSLSDS